MPDITLFLEQCDHLEDPRIAGLVTYPLNELLLTTLCGVLCGHEDWEAIAYWAEHHLEWLRQFLPYEAGIPTAQTFYRVFQALNSKQFGTMFEKWVASLSLDSDPKHPHIAIDGKTVRGSKKASDGSGAIHMVSAFATQAGLVIGQEKTAEKSNEITAIPVLLERLALEGSVITIDAMGTQTEIVEKICHKHADYLLVVKGNQACLEQDIKLFFQDHEKKAALWDEYEETDAGHGRIEIRQCVATSDIAWLQAMHPQWRNLRSIAMIQSTRIQKKTHTQTTETRFYMSSLTASAQKIQELARSHWGIENRLHWCLDMHFKEDSSRVRTHHSAENLTIIRKMALNLLRRDPASMPLKRKMLRASLELDYLKARLVNR